jgi:hypothetical protein
MTGDEITCENCGEVIERRGGKWMHEAFGGFYERCWPNKNFYAIPEFPSMDDESEDA